MITIREVVETLRIDMYESSVLYKAKVIKIDCGEALKPLFQG